jgi:hypothetical protein
MDMAEGQNDIGKVPFYGRLVFTCLSVYEIVK